ncbi:MAG TPA: methionyl-tRNA formyltransferase, partial [Verrucomicrobiales bacterium]|nr:methionyl-tRNA formyltransferase [Verrucomicrobiales bacterium]
MTPLRIVFMGTPELARTILVTLSDAPFARIVATVVQPDRPAGRHLQPVAAPVKVEAIRRGLPVLQPERARDPVFVDQLRALSPDLLVVAAYGQILPASILELPRYGCLNVHTSLLPRWRGAAPIQWAIAEGDAETGVTIMQMDTGLDTGPTLRLRSTTVSDQDTGQSLHDRLAVLGGELLV